MQDFWHLTNDLEYLALFTIVLILPKILLKIKIPSGISSLLLGVICAYFIEEVKTDQLFRFLAQIGITSLFLFSGFEVEFDEIKEDKAYLTKYLLKSCIILGVITFGFKDFMNLPLQTSLILALGIFTPSAGFIINSLHSLKIGEDQEYWVKSKAISKEVVSILILFFALQSGDLGQLALSTLFFIALFYFLPKIFKFFFKYISPIAPNSEVPFLVALSLIAGVLSKELGAYYLVGAFIVGLVASSFKKDIFHENEEILFKSLSGFFMVFLPFYFFQAGVKLNFKGFSIEAIQLGLIFLAIFVPLRLMINNSSIRFFLKDFKQMPYSISLSLMPTLIFGLVIAGVLKERQLVGDTVVYGLIFYTLVTSMIPTFLFAFQREAIEQGFE